jgi:hypothetical protein
MIYIIVVKPPHRQLAPVRHRLYSPDCGRWEEALCAGQPCSAAFDLYLALLIYQIVCPLWFAIAVLRPIESKLLAMSLII